MILLEIDSIPGYKPKPDFLFRVYEDGRVHYTGRYYVGKRGDHGNHIAEHKVSEINMLLDYLVKRNQKNHLKKMVIPAYAVEVGEELKWRFEVDSNDVVSEDIVDQIIDLAGVRRWIQAKLDLYIVMSLPGIRSREMAALRASDGKDAIELYLNDRGRSQVRTRDDYLVICIGQQVPGTILNPVIYFAYRDYQIKEHPKSLLLNQGAYLANGKMNMYLFISFGKRFNDPGASYFLVIGKDKSAAAEIFKSAYPHFMPRDFQQVDIGVVYQPIPLFETHIPVAIR